MGGGRWWSSREPQPEPALAERYRTDMVAFTPGPHDVRVARGGWVLYVRAVRGGQSLVGPRIGVEVVVAFLASQVVQWFDLPTPVLLASFGSLGGALVALNLVRWRRHRDRPWRVGVVRGPDPASWNTGQPVVVLEQELARGEHPSARVAELADRARAGEFDPAA